LTAGVIGIAATLSGCKSDSSSGPVVSPPTSGSTQLPAGTVVSGDILEELMKMSVMFSEGKQLIGYHGNDHKAELRTSIPITKGGPYKKYSVMSTHVTNIKSGDAILFFSEIQVSCRESYNTMVSTHVIRSDSPTSNVGKELAEANGMNINKSIHHLPIRRTGMYIATADMSDLYINLLLYSASSAVVSGAKLLIDQDYGRSFALHFR
jgi:hypothetical protein